MTTDRIERVIDLPFPQERVWRAITRPEELSQWFSDRVSLEPAVGGELLLDWDEYGQATGSVEIFEPPRRFAFRWRAHGVDANAPLAADNSTLVTFTLEPSATGTKLEVVETGFAALPAALRQSAYKENVSGWKVELQELVDYLGPS